MVKILFVVPPHISFDDFTHPADSGRQTLKNDGKLYGRLISDMPIGILSISSYIKKFEPVHAQLVDFNVELNELTDFKFTSFLEYFKAHFQKHPLDFQPDIVAISSLFNPSFFNLLDAAKCCRELFPKAIILGGGSVPTSLYQEIFAATQAFDALCHGEGEKPMLELIRVSDRLAHLQKSPYWITKEKAARNETFSYDFIDDLDDIPFLDYDLCQLEKYGKNPAIDGYGGVKSHDNNFHVMTSRGCPFKCSFCASHKVHGRTMRYYSLERVRTDFIRLRDQYGANPLVFQDDHFMADGKRALAIIRLVKELGMPVIFQNGLAIYALDREVLEALKAAGVTQLVLSVESGSERVLRHIMHKPLKLSDVPRVSKECRDLEIYTSVNILIGSPGETKQDIEDARVFLKTIYANWFLVHCASPLAGSEMFDVCKKNNLFKGDHIGSHYKKAVVETEDFTAEYIQDKAYELNLELNFVENSDFRLGQYEVALRGLESAIRAKADHALGLHFQSHCHNKLGNTAKATEYLNKAEAIFKESAYWKHFADIFNITVKASEALKL